MEKEKAKKIIKIISVFDFILAGFYILLSSFFIWGFKGVVMTMEGLETLFFGPVILLVFIFLLSMTVGISVGLIVLGIKLRRYNETARTISLFVFGLLIFSKLKFLFAIFKNPSLIKEPFFSIVLYFAIFVLVIAIPSFLFLFLNKSNKEIFISKS